MVIRVAFRTYYKERAISINISSSNFRLNITPNVGTYLFYRSSIIIPHMHADICKWKCCEQRKDTFIKSTR